MNQLKRDAQLFKAISHPTRLVILSVLRRQDGELDVVALLDHLTRAGITIQQPTLSHHLKEMRQAGIIDYAEHGLWHYYSICHGVQSEIACIIERYTGQAQGRAS